MHARLHMDNVRPRYMDFFRKSSNPASFYPRRMSAYTGFLTHFPCAETEDFRKSCRGGRLCPPAEKSRFYENLRRIRTAKGRKAASAPRVYLKTPNAPGQRVFSRCAAPFFLEIRQYSCEKTSCSAQEFLAAGHIESWKNTP